VRALRRTIRSEEEEESVFVTMTDMTVSFLLIIMILLAFFAAQISHEETVPLSVHDTVRAERDMAWEEAERLTSELERLDRQVSRLTVELREVAEERDRALAERNDLLEQNEVQRLRITDLERELRRLQAQLEKVTDERNRLREQLKGLQQVNPLEEYLAQGIKQRREILAELRDRLLIEFPDLQVVVSPEQDALRFQGEGLFRSGSSHLQPRQREIVETMARLLDEMLVCFTLGNRAHREPSCGSGNALIEAVQIEGHTDSDGNDTSNLRLSTDRANQTFLVMLGEDQAILAHENLRGQSVMSVSGYGKMRPIASNETSEGKAANRRIDLRIIMYAPTTGEEVEEIGRRLDLLRAAGHVE